MAEALSAHHPVLFVDPSRSSRHGVGLDLSPTLSEVGDNLWHLKGVAVPAHTRTAMGPLMAHLVGRATTRALDTIGAGLPVATLLQTPQTPVLGQVPADVKVYWATDDFTAGAALMGVDPSAMATAEARSAADADLVVAVSEPLAGRWIAHGKEATVIPTGVDVPPLSSLEVNRAPTSLQEPAVGVFGTLSPRLDFGILKAIADRGISTLLVGPAVFRHDRDRFDAFVDLSNVEWVGQQPHHALPSFYATISVGIVPYVDSDFNRASAPLKAMEYLAMGKAVVSTPLPAIERLDSPDIAFSADPENFAGVVAERLSRPITQADIDRRRDQMRQHDWTNRALDLLRVIGSPASD